ncbi:hypothetical protein FNF29_06383 [Cafeteria roenbergensis]|uniref:Calpain catalytic domain-containing protein n=1 Tax=Cafeteria roenbergensis TaxID=33653 RepID=A0A5A8C8L1_CAFRO|nr:hypothetical protein FNF29_06383 [Cafeteria roenbergensis]|eukprot:KAA0148909.1 hypothetical protein FNF29_06383 [Cafeteria roenbergensis]
MDPDEALRLAIEASLENAGAPAEAPNALPAQDARVEAREADDFDDELTRAIRASMGEAAASTMSDDGAGLDGGTCVADEERRADLEYDHCLAHSMQANRPFSDPEFVPSAASLGSGKTTTTMRVRASPTAPVEVREVPVLWLRPKEIGHRERGEREWTLSHRQPAGSDVAQGTEGDCWLVSAMSVAAEGDGHVAHALRSASAEGCGAVQIRLCLGGLWTVVTVDDLIPCDALSRRPIFASGREQQLWPCFIEKAIAKVTGSYRALSGGQVSEGLRLMTGASVTALLLSTNETREERTLRRAAASSLAALERTLAHFSGTSIRVVLGSGMQQVVKTVREAGLSLDPERARPAGGRAAAEPRADADLTWARLASWKDSGCLMGAACGKAGMEWEDERKAVRDAAAAVGLQTEHAYSVLELTSVGSDRLLRLRNPWGRGEYTGKYGTSWPGWTPELRSQLGAFEMEGSGIFFIEFNDFLRHFDTVEVARVHKGWSTARSASLMAESARGATAEGGFPAWEIVSPEDGDVYLTLWQASSRLRGGGRLRGLAPGESLRQLQVEGVIGDDGRPSEGQGPGSPTRSSGASAGGAEAARAAGVTAGAPGVAVGGDAGPALRASNSAVLDEAGRVLSRDRRKPAPERTELGIAVFAGGRASSGSASEPVGSYVGGALRTLQDSVNADVSITAGRRYTVVPLAMAHMARKQWQEAVLSVQSPSPVRLRRVTLSARRFAEAIVERVTALGMATFHSAGDDGDIVVRELAADNCMMLVLENRTSSRLVTLEYTVGAEGLTASREAFFCTDTIPPQTVQLIQVLTVDSAGGSYSYSGSQAMSIEKLASREAALTSEAHFPPVSGMHSPFPLV